MTERGGRTKIGGHCVGQISEECEEGRGGEERGGEDGVQEA